MGEGGCTVQVMLEKVKKYLEEGWRGKGIFEEGWRGEGIFRRGMER